MKITFPDGNIKEFPQGTTGLEIAQSISDGLARISAAIQWESKVLDLGSPIPGDGTVKIITLKDKQGLETFRHSSAHVMALAVTRLFSGVKLAIGPVIEDGFYYDFDNIELKNSDFQKIDEENCF